MRTIDLLIRGLRNLRRNKSRTILTILALSIGAFTLVLTFGLSNALKTSVNNQLSLVASNELTVRQITESKEQVGVAEFNATVPRTRQFQGEGAVIELLTKEQIDAFGKIPGVRQVWPNYNISARYLQVEGNDKKYVVDTINEQAHSDQAKDMLSGAYPTDWSENDIILSQSYADTLGITAGDLVGKVVTLGFLDAKAKDIEQKFTIVGVLKKPTGFEGNGSDKMGIITISLEAMAKIYETQFDGTRDFNQFTYATVLLASSDNETSVRDAITAINKDYNVSSLSDIVSQIKKVLNTITYALAGFSGIALLAAAFGIINTQLMSVFERTKEIGLLKALGMSNKKIRSLFSVEAILIGLLGASVGIIFAFIVEIVVNTVFKQKLLDIGFGSHAILISPINVLMVAAGLGLLSFVAGVFPARKAQRLDPIQALREE
ncbi:MAG: ABC transporter permease [Patescibacteria group bacterium]|nr:ABC transporter permease [Patescibacteria group bacterium]